MIKNKK